MVWNPSEPKTTQVPKSEAWGEFLANLREATTLLRADPTSRYAMRQATMVGASIPAASITQTEAINKGCVLLVSGRLQGYIAAVVEEFLERIDASGVQVDQIPESLRTQLCRWYHAPRKRPSELEIREVHKRYAVLWTAGAALPPGTIKADCFDEGKNPWSDNVQAQLRRCGVDLFQLVEDSQGAGYLQDLRTYVDELVKFRNSVAHGDNPANTWTAADVRLRMAWAIRLARACDGYLGEELAAVTGASW